MPKINFLPSNKSIEVDTGVELLEAARKAGVSIDAPCGGEGTCGKCMVKIVSGDVDSDSLGLLTQEEVADGYVLACRTKLISSSVTVDVPDQIGKKNGKFTEIYDDIKLVREELFPKKIDFKPVAQKWFIKVAEPQLEDGLSDLDRLTRSIQDKAGKKEIVYSLAAIKRLADALRNDNGNITVTIITENDRYHIIEIAAGDKTKNDYGIVVDLGTTTVAVKIANLGTGNIVATMTDYNDQIECGLDVISRINYSQKKGRLEELRARALNTINRLLNHIASTHNINTNEIYNAVVSGNTTMIHLLLGLNPEYIRLKPYTPTLLEAPYITAEEVGIEIYPDSWVYISPAVGSYVGGDITAGLLCTDIAMGTEDVNLFIDIGTNGEIVVGNNEFLMTCACSAGPAFEGGGIECGMRASLGAIDHVEIDPESGRSSFTTIGDEAPVGICGSGMISLLANLFLTGWMDAAGKLNRSKECEFVRVNGRRAEYIISNEKDKAIVISELDIENIIRAKAAIYSACALILNQIGMDFKDLKNIYIAGGFGRFLEIDKAIVLGLVPDFPMNRFKYIGNSSLIGGYMILLSKEFQKRQVDISRRMTYLELNTDPTYMDQYTGALFIPHTDASQFPNIKPMQ